MQHGRQVIATAEVHTDGHSKLPVGEWRSKDCSIGLSSERLYPLWKLQPTYKPELTVHTLFQKSAWSLGSSKHDTDAQLTTHFGTLWLQLLFRDQNAD